MWKNFLLRQRRYIITCFEILLPTLPIIFLVIYHVNVKPIHPHDNDRRQYNQNDERDYRGNERSFTTQSNQYDREDKMNYRVKERNFEIKSEEYMIKQIRESEYSPYKTICEGNRFDHGYENDGRAHNCTLAFTPNNIQTTQVMKIVLASLNGKSKLKGFNNEEDIEIYISNLFDFDPDKYRHSREVWAAIVFKEGLHSSNFKNNHKISYKIRLSEGNYRGINTKTLFPSKPGHGPNLFNEKLYIDSGFSGLQVTLEKALIQLLTNINTPISFNTQGFPYPAYIESEIKGTVSISLVLPILIVVGFLLIVPSIIPNIVSEKQTGIKELMKMMGLPNWMHWLGWMIDSMTVLVFTVTVIIFSLYVSFSEDAGPLISSENDWTLAWVVLCLYAMASTSFCFFISSLFQLPMLATVAAIILWIVTYFGTFIPLDKIYDSLSIYDKLAVTLLPNMALHWFFKIVDQLVAKGDGARWDNIASSTDVFEPLAVGHLCLMLIVDTILYMSLAIYLENIIPSEYGIRKSWYYIFKPSTWMSGRKVNVMPLNTDNEEESVPGFETEPKDLTPGIIIRNLSKRFGRHKVAVDNISLKMFDGHITALLGHNGAGKTTTMSMLTGLFAPTSGTVMINGYNINTQLNQVRNSLGLCPQHNLLFDNLTTGEHLVFFGRLKGLTLTQAKAEMTVLLGQLRLAEKQNILSKYLSGGQKRKLSLGIALIGGTKVLILDEPTSGMDPETRRAIWDILLEMRGQRTILLTTHYMEEADVLGDRIAIMADGKIKCSGTPIYLKRFYGAGYTLRMTLAPNSNKGAILSIVQKSIPPAFWKSEISSNPLEIAITLPSDAETISLFPSMFADLDEKKEKSGIIALGLSLTTMDDVFIKVGELADDEHEGEDKTVEKLNSNRKNLLLDEISRTSPVLKKVRGVFLPVQQFWGLFVKRFLYAQRRRGLSMLQFVVPLLVHICVILLVNSMISPKKPPVPLEMKLSDYEDARTLYISLNKKLGESYASYVGSSAVQRGGILNEELLEVGRKDTVDYRRHYFVAAHLTSISAHAMFSTIPIHTNPLAINLVSNAILRAYAPGKKYSIVVTNHPLKDELGDIFSLDDSIVRRVTEFFTTLIFGTFIFLSLAVFSACYVVFPIEERICKSKQLQLMTGVSPLIFWGSSFFWDFFMMIILILLMVICCLIFQINELFTAHGGLGVLILILLAYGFATIPFSYLCSLFLETVPGGFAFATVIHIVTGFLAIGIHFFEGVGITSKTFIIYFVIRIIGAIFPSFGVTLCIIQYARISVWNSRCSAIPEKYKSLICDSNVENKFKQCCTDCIETATQTCYKTKSYLDWNKAQAEQFEDSEETIQMPGILQNILYLVLLGILCKCLLFLIEYGFLQYIVGILFKSEESTFDSSKDVDVQAETERVHNLIQTGHASDEALVVEDLCKSYGSFSAVSNICFGVHYGECFGLLGVNGAGKTTTFRMLTGDEIRSSGNAFRLNLTFENNRKKFLANLGYCPQFDGIIGVLTGREMLELFCWLRGIPKGKILSVAEEWLKKMGLYESGNVQCRKYSGGMKRRLSAGMALVGNPGILLLDEPTSGVDPVSRRRFWNVLSEIRDSGQAVILTSHSMDECEALCSRLGIMVNGQFQCFGGVQHLKSKFVQGYSLLLKLKALISTQSPELETLKYDIQTMFDPCDLKDEHLNVLQYQVYNTIIPWGFVFQTMEFLKKQYENIIEDFSVNETTLEEVFLSLARNQYSPRVANVSCLKKVCTCQCC